MNICVLQGVVVGDPHIKQLTSGETALSFDVQTSVDGKRQPAVPVEWTGPSSKTPRVTADALVAVTGVAARRFYRTGGSTQTRVYVKPETIVVRQPKRQRQALRKRLEAGISELGD